MGGCLSRAGGLLSGRLRGAALLAALLAPPACSRPAPELSPRLDLVAGFGLAGQRTETPFVDFGSPEARPLLLGGWSIDESEPRSGRTLVWGLGGGSALRFHLFEARDLEAILECRPARLPDGREQRLTVRVNGEPVAELTLRPGIHAYPVRLPAERLRGGDNELAFDYAASRPSGEQPGESRALAVAWYRIDFQGVHAPPAPARAEADAIFVPFGSELEYLTMLDPGSELRLDGLRFRGRGEAVLRILAETDDGGRRELAALRPGTEPEPVPFGATAPVPARLLLRATGGTGTGADEGILIQGPRIWSLSPPARAEPPPRSRAGAPPRPNVIVYLVDTLRRDRLGCYGYGRPVSPNIDAFAEEAILFENAVGVTTWTRASVASLFTGLWPGAHGAVGRVDKLPEAPETLAEILRKAGYRTAAVVGNPNVHQRFGFDQGFDHYVHLSEDNDSVAVNELIFRWLEEGVLREPFFLYVHTIDPHDPYEPPEEFRRRFAPGTEAIVESDQRHIGNEAILDSLEALYDAEIAFNDDSFGRLVARLRQEGLYEDSFLALVSDHGEEFLEHGRWTHGKTLHAETLDFPFLVRYPGQRQGLRIDGVVQIIDLLPSLLEHLRLELPPFVDGRSFAHLFDPGRTAAEVAGERFYAHLELDGPLNLSIIDGDWKMIERHGRRRLRRSLYNWRLDPGETRDLAAERPIHTAVLAALLSARLASQPLTLASEEAELDEELIESLRALGYLQ